MCYVCSGSLKNVSQFFLLKQKSLILFAYLNFNVICVLSDKSLFTQLPCDITKAVILIP